MELILGLTGDILGLVVFLVVVYFGFYHNTTDRRVKKLADLAFVCAAGIAGLSARGSTPSVNLKDGAWKVRGVNVIGNYKWIGLFGVVLWDRILVVDDPFYIWRNLVHEMTHAVRRRAGKKLSELAAEVAEGLADELAQPEVKALLEKL